MYVLESRSTVTQMFCSWELGSSSFCPSTQQSAGASGDCT